MNGSVEYVVDSAGVRWRLAALPATANGTGPYNRNSTPLPRLLRTLSRGCERRIMQPQPGLYMQMPPQLWAVHTGSTSVPRCRQYPGAKRRFKQVAVGATTTAYSVIRADDHSTVVVSSTPLKYSLL